MSRCYEEKKSQPAGQNGRRERTEADDFKEEEEKKKSNIGIERNVKECQEIKKKKGH